MLFLYKHIWLPLTYCGCCLCWQKLSSGFSCIFTWKCQFIWSKHIITKINLSMFSSFKLNIQFIVHCPSSMHDSSTSAVLAEVWQWGLQAGDTQRWDRHRGGLWDPGGPWVQTSRHVPAHPASLAARWRLCQDVHAYLKQTWGYLQRRIISCLANETLPSQ